MVRILIVLMLVMSLVSCITPKDPTITLEDGSKVKASELKDKLKDAGVIEEKEEEEGASDVAKLGFYALGAICIIGAICILLVLKNIGYAAICAGGGVFFCIVPFFLDLLYELLGPLKWIILVAIVIVIGGFLILFFVKIRSVLHDLTHHEDDDVHIESDRIRKGAKGWKSMKNKLKEKIGLE